MGTITSVFAGPEGMDEGRAHCRLVPCTPWEQIAKRPRGLSSNSIRDAS